MEEINQLDERVRPEDRDKFMAEVAFDLEDMKEFELREYLGLKIIEKSWLQRLWDWLCHL